MSAPKRERLSCECGSVLVSGLLFSLALLLVIGVAVDLGRAFIVRRELATLADDAALSGSQALDLRAVHAGRLELDPADARSTALRTLATEPGVRGHATAGPNTVTRHGAPPHPDGAPAACRHQRPQRLCPGDGDPARAMKTAALVAVRCVVASVAIALLSKTRPEWPDLPSSLEAPLTVTAVEQTVVLALWVTACGIVAWLLARTVAIALTRRPADRRIGLDLRNVSGPRPGRTPVPATPRFAPTYMVAAPVPPDGTAVSTSESTPAPAVATAESTRATQEDHSPGGAAISLLGPLSIEGPDQPRRAATKELIAYLALNHEATRDQLLEALWPGQDPRRTRPRLWQSVSEAARLLGDAFVHKRDRYRLDQERVKLDAAELDRLIASADTADHPAAESAALEAALALWRGDPLVGADYQWAEGAIRHLEATHVDLLERVARARLEAGDAPAALEAAERGIATDELHEGFWRLALQAEGDLGRRDALNERYETLRKLLDDRLGLQPNRTTNTLYRQLLGQG